MGEKKEYWPEQMAALILKNLKERAEAACNKVATRVVIPVPSFFSSNQRQAMISAAKIAGFEGARIISEPTAIAIAYRFKYHP